MKRFQITFYSIFLISALSLLAQPTYSNAQSPASQNHTDKQGFRQGYWVLHGGISSDEGYSPTQKVEEGEYLDNKRTGVWKKYYPTGVLQSKIDYIENHPYGSYTTYYPNSKVEEAGFWAANKNTGDFKRFHENGELAQEFNFNARGKRDGVQKYYFPDGKLQCSVEIENGVAHGEYILYYANGEKREEKRITNGEVETQSVKIFELAKPLKNVTAAPELSKEETTPKHVDKPNLGIFKDTGFNTLYNRNRQITQVGDFYEGRLWNGKWHKYDENGILKRVEVYREGRFIGYGIIDDSNN